MGLITLTEVDELIAAPKFLLAEMAWLNKRGKITFQWVSCRINVQLHSEAAAREQFYVECQWRTRGNRIPEQWTFNLIYQGNRIYALHVQPMGKHPNKVGKGRPFYKQEIDGIHEHIWVDEGDGYAEPINVPLDDPETIWKMFLRRANIDSGAFYHPDDNQPEMNEYEV